MLDDLNILIVEDEALIALDLTMIVEERGAAVEGPCHTVEAGVKAVSDKVDAAILDVDLQGKLVFPVADKLRDAGKPFVFHTGRMDRGALRERYGDVPILEKPAPEQAIVDTLKNLVAS